MTHQQHKHVPKDAQVIMSILKDVGINDYEPKVINQLLEFTYRYVTCILDDARVFANHAKKKIIELDDVKLAVNMISDRSFTSPPPRDMLMEVARAKNNIPLPLLKPHCGLRLPPDRYCLAACNYRIKTNKKPQPTPKVGILGSGSSGLSSKNPTINLVKRSQLTTIARTQSITMPKPIPKPVIKFSPITMQIPTNTLIKTKTTSSSQMISDQIKRKHEEVEPMDTE